MTVPTTTPSDPGFYEALARLHGHRCPMSILGARLGLAAREALERSCTAGARLEARYLHRTCALDGIQMATHCTPGNGNLHVEPRGEHRLVLRAQGSGDEVSAHLTDESLERGRAYSDLRSRAEGLGPLSPERVRLETQMERILVELEQAPALTLVAVDIGSG